MQYSEKKWKMGLVGLGGSKRSAAYMHHPQIEVVSICDQDHLVLEETGNELGLPDHRRFQHYHDFLGSDIDFVMIGSPIPFHAEQTIAALDAGKHVLCEVTAASTIQQCLRIVEAVERTGLTYMMAENTVYFHFLREWKKQVHSGRLGTIFYAECEYVHQIRHRVIDPVTGERLWRDDRPPLHYCSHSLGPILEIMEDRIIRAMGIGQSKTIMPHGGVGSIDIQVALFETSKGAVIKLLRSSVAAREPALGFYTLYGSKGQMENSRGLKSTGMMYVEGEEEFANGALPISCDISDPHAPEEAKKGGHGTSEYYLIHDFIHALNKRISTPIDVYRAMEYTLPGLIAQQSAERQGIWMDVPQVR